MKSWFNLIWQTLKVFILFTSCTILFYFAIIWLNEEYQNYHRYDEPNGAAMKASTSQMLEYPAWFERLILFYLNGE